MSERLTGEEWEMSDIGDAIQEMREGGKVRREGWEEQMAGARRLRYLAEER